MIAQIEADDVAAADSGGYYRHWLAALESLLAERGIVASTDVTRRANDAATAATR